MYYKRLILFEGNNGSGKESQTKLLLRYLHKKGKKAVRIDFPRYNTKIGSLIKDYLYNGDIKTQNTYYIALLYAADRYEEMPKILDYLRKGYFVLLDRYTESNIVYQGAIGGKEIKQWIKKVESKLPKAGTKIFLKLPLEVSLELMKNRKKDIHEKDISFLEKVNKEYNSLIKKEKNWHVIECFKENRLLSKDEIHKKILEKLRDLL